MHPILLKVGRLTLYSYGAMIAIGFVAASRVAGRRALRIGLDPVKIQNVALAGLIGGIGGGRLAYVALNWPIYRSDWMEILRLDHGGLVFYGGFAVGLAAVLAVILWARMPLGRTVDLLVPPLVLAHAFGRIGCFLNGCCYGKPSSVPWAVAFPGEGIPRHPTQLYEMLFLLGLFAFLKGLERRSPRPWTLLLTYGLAYGLWRFAVEFLRGDNPVVWAGLTAFQLASVALILVSGCLLLLKPKR